MLNSNNPPVLNIVVTAASTPVGRETVRQLVAHGHTVTGLTQGADGAAIVREDGGLPAYSNLFRAGEIKSILHMAAPDVVINLTPQVANTFPHPAMSWEENLRILTEGTNALLAAIDGSSTKFVVHTSYTSVYGDTHGEWVDESHKPHPIPELSSALQAEEQFLNGSVPAAILRAGIVYGSDDAGTGELAESTRRGRGLFLGDSHAYHNWVYAPDFARAVVLAAEAQPAGEIFNIVDDTPVSAATFANHLAHELGLPAPRNNASLPEFARRLVNKPYQENLLGFSTRVKNDKAKESLGWTPRYADYRSGIEQTLIGWRADMRVR